MQWHTTHLFLDTSSATEPPTDFGLEYPSRLSITLTFESVVYRALKGHQIKGMGAAHPQNENTANPALKGRHNWLSYQDQAHRKTYVKPIKLKRRKKIDKIRLFLFFTFNILTMGQSLVQNYIHLIFSTKHRQPLIQPTVEADLHAYLGGICNRFDSQPIIIGGFTDHIHILSKLSKKIALMKLVEEVKSHSSKWIKTRGEQFRDFYWQDGYGAFSVNPLEKD